MGFINWGSPLGTGFRGRKARRLKHFNKNKAEAEEAMGSGTEQFSFITERQVSEPSLSQCCGLTYFTITHAAGYSLVMKGPVHMILLAWFRGCWREDSTPPSTINAFLLEAVFPTLAWGFLWCLCINDSGSAF